MESNYASGTMSNLDITSLVSSKELSSLSRYHCPSSLLKSICSLSGHSLEFHLELWIRLVVDGQIQKKLFENVRKRSPEKDMKGNC